MDSQSGCAKKTREKISEKIIYYYELRVILGWVKYELSRKSEWVKSNGPSRTSEITAKLGNVSSTEFLFDEIIFGTSVSRSFRIRVFIGSQNVDTKIMLNVLHGRVRCHVSSNKIMQCHDITWYNKWLGRNSYPM